MTVVVPPIRSLHCRASAPGRKAATRDLRRDHAADARQHAAAGMSASVDSFASGPMWAGFIAFVLGMLALDLFVFGGRKAHRVSVRRRWPG
jgi:hypothetical protein